MTSYLPEIISRTRSKSPQKETHKMESFHRLLVKYGQGVGIDPFARNCEHAHFTNDINPNTSAKQNLDALEFLESYLHSSFDFVIFDPPFSDEMSKRKYGTANLYSADSGKASQCQRTGVLLLKLGGFFIKAGYNSNRPAVNTELIEIVLVANGGNRNDFIFSVWQKTSSLDGWVE